MNSPSSFFTIPRIVVSFFSSHKRHQQKRKIWRYISSSRLKGRMYEIEKNKTRKEDSLNKLNDHYVPRCIVVLDFAKNRPRFNIRSTFLVSYSPSTNAICFNDLVPLASVYIWMKPENHETEFRDILST